MRFRLRSLFVLIFLAALGALFLRHILKSRPVVGEVTAYAKSGLIEVSIGAEDGAVVGQCVEVSHNGGYVGRARIIRVNDGFAIANRASMRYRLEKGDRVVLLPRDPGG